MRVFQEEIFGPVVSVTTFKDDDEPLAVVNDTLYGLGASVWTRNGSRACRFGRAIYAGRVWTNCYHAHFPFITVRRQIESILRSAVVGL
jgi:aldehyde dehydrogenase